MPERGERPRHRPRGCDQQNMVVRETSARIHPRPYDGPLALFCNSGVLPYSIARCCRQTISQSYPYMLILLGSSRVVRAYAEIDIEYRWYWDVFASPPRLQALQLVESFEERLKARSLISLEFGSGLLALFHFS